MIGTARSGRGLTEILSPTGAPVAGLCGDGAVTRRFSTGFGPECHEHLPRTLSDRPNDLVVFRLGEQFQRGRTHVSLGRKRQEKRSKSLVGGGFHVDDEVIRSYGEIADLDLNATFFAKLPRRRSAAALP